MHDYWFFNDNTDFFNLFSSNYFMPALNKKKKTIKNYQKKKNMQAFGQGQQLELLIL